MFGPLARLMYRRRWYVVAVWAAIVVVAGVFAAQAGSLLGAPDYSPSSSDSSRVASILDRTFHQNGLKQTLVTLSSPTHTTADSVFRTGAAGVAQRLRSDRALKLNAVDNPLVSGNTQSISRDHHAIIITFSTALSESDMEAQVPHLRAITRAPGLTTRLTGYSVLSYESNQVSSRDLARAESITLPILLAVLILVFGALVAVGIPFLIALVSIVLSIAAVWVGAHFLTMSVYVVDIITFIGLGIAVDYSLFIVNRFREELATGIDSETAVVRTMETTGRAIFFSGLAVAVGLSSLLLTGLSFMEAMGVAGMVIPVSTLLVTLTLLPAVLGILGERVNRFRVLPTRYLAATEGRFWHALATSIMRRPWLAGGAVLIVLIALAVPATRLTLSQGTLKQQQGTTPGVAALDYLRGHFHTAPDPFVIVVQRPGASVATSRDLASMLRLETQVRRDPEVARVFGPPDALGTSQPSAARAHRLAGRMFSPNLRTAIITVVPKDDSTSAANMAGLRRIRTIASRLERASMAGATVIVGGSSATLVDFDNIIIQRLPLIILVVLGLTYAFLFVAFRTVFLPLKAVLLNVLSVGAAFGMLQLVFQEGFGVQLLGGSQADGVPTWVLLFLFAFLFGLSMDYEVLLLSRIREAWLDRGDNEAAVVLGLQRTGRLISSAALIMAVAFSGFMLGTALWMKMMGFGLTVSILVDATLIRVVLVPSIMKLVGRWNWWVPGRLSAWSHRGGIERPATPEPHPEEEPALV